VNLYMIFIVDLLDEKLTDHGQKQHGELERGLIESETIRVRLLQIKRMTPCSDVSSESK